MFGVSFDGVDANRAFAEKHAFPFRLLCDTERRLGLAYRACDEAGDAYPRRITYVVGATGVIEQAIATEDVQGQAEALVASFGDRPSA